MLTSLLSLTLGGGALTNSEGTVIKSAPAQLAQLASANPPLFHVRACEDLCVRVTCAFDYVWICEIVLNNCVRVRIYICECVCACVCSV
jgi:hypothetical protein